MPIVRYRVRQENNSFNSFQAASETGRRASSFQALADCSAANSTPGRQWKNLDGQMLNA